MYKLDVNIHFQTLYQKHILVIDSSIIVELVFHFFSGSNIVLMKTFCLYVETSPHLKFSKFRT